MRSKAICLAVAATVAALGLGAGPACASATTSARAMAAYESAIRYFNPGIGESDARSIVTAIITDAYQQGVDPRLVVAIIATESSFDRTARSSAGAMGLGQL